MGCNDTHKAWEHFSHESDIGIRGYGATIEDAFAMGALALTHVVTNSQSIKPDKKMHISCKAPNLELLFVDWLNAIIYHMATQNMVFNQFELCIKDLQLTAIISGEHVDMKRHHPAVEVKGATYTELKVYKIKQHWVAQCVVDV